MGEEIRMRVIILMTMWRRPELTNYVCRHYRKMKAELAYDMELTLLAVGSEKEKSKEIAVKNGFEYLEYPNRPHNKKINAGFLRAKDYNPDLVFFVDSDAIISREYFKAMKMQSESEVVGGLSDYYFLDFYKKRLGYWPGYPKGERHGGVVGPGKCFSKKILDKLSWQTMPAVVKSHSGMDWHCRQKLRAFGIKIKGYKMNQIGCFAMDVKTGQNFYQWEELKYAGITEGAKLKRLLKKTGFIDVFDLKINKSEKAGNLNQRGRRIRSDISLYLRHGQDVPVRYKAGEFIANPIIKKFNISNDCFDNTEEDR